MKARLILEDGAVYHGRSFGADEEVFGEIVFNTSMSGYQEIITDLSYAGQILLMTYPHIGNYGVNSEDMESDAPALNGLILRELCEHPSNHRSESTLDDFLETHNIPGLQGIDTRSLTRRIRDVGAMRSMITSSKLPDDELISKVKSSDKMTGSELASSVSSNEVRPFGGEGSAFNIAVIDYGIKGNIVKELIKRECSGNIFPATVSAEKIIESKPDGVLLSNGPGDPAAVDYAIECIKELLSYVPLFGICLGHQLLAHAMGAKTYKLKFGHRGANHPVLDKLTGKVEITVQNHGFAVSTDSVDGDEMVITHVNLNDGTVEGLRHRQLPLFSVQYHPEAAPGPHDSRYLFDRFINMMNNDKK